MRERPDIAVDGRAAAPVFTMMLVMPAEGLEPPTNGLQNEHPAPLRSAPRLGWHPNSLIPRRTRDANPSSRSAPRSREE